jgi:putative nucleotidyltransferase with HDIG domain
VQYGIAAIGLALWVELTTPYSVAPVMAWVLIPALAMIAEFLPVEISRHGLRITFSMPFLAGMAVAVGATGALLTDLIVTLAFGIVLGIQHRKTIAPLWICLNLSVAAISASSAGLAFVFLRSHIVSRHATTYAAVLFTLVYSLVNFVLVSNIEAKKSHTKLTERLHATAAIGAQGAVLYCLAAIAVAVCVSKGLFLFAALTLLPIIVLRRVLKLRTQMYEHYYETVTALTLMLQRAHPYTHGHLERVARISEDVALRLGLPAHRARLVREASVLHDIGKIAVDEAILDKPAKLTQEEFAHVKRHSALGAQILTPVESMREIVPWIRHHHERPDGTGYPDGLSDVEIPLESKIIAVVDAFDAMTGGDHPGDKRPYREPITTEQAVVELERCSGTQFDTNVVQAFKYVLRSNLV